jgi:cell division protein FtsN
LARHARKRGAPKGGGSSLAWFVGGLLLGAVGAALFFRQGLIPGVPERTEIRDTPPPTSEPGLLDDDNGSAADNRYDFFTVLPEMEVVVPERELAQRPAEDSSTAANDGGESYVLQVGSFRSAADADQMKARLALLGSVAQVQTVTVDRQTWHRVRIGPVSGSREANSLRRRLQDNGIDVLVLKGTD